MSDGGMLDQSEILENVPEKISGKQFGKMVSKQKFCNTRKYDDSDKKKAKSLKKDHNNSVKSQAKETKNKLTSAKEKSRWIMSGNSGLLQQ